MIYLLMFVTEHVPYSPTATITAEGRMALNQSNRELSYHRRRQEQSANLQLQRMATVHNILF